MRRGGNVTCLTAGTNIPERTQNPGLHGRLSRQSTTYEPHLVCVLVPSSLIKGDLLGRARDALLVERSVRRVRRLLDRRAPLIQPGRDDRVRVLEEADKLTREGLVGFGEEGDRFAGAAGATRSADAVDVLAARQQSIRQAL